MSSPLKLYIQSIRKAKKKRRQLACAVTALSVLVSGSVFWQLRGIGTAMVDKNLPAADDSGGGIDVTQLFCSELETPDIWEATLPPLTDSAGENIARIAESQLGYTESSVNFIHAEDGETHSGYTRYGAWYGNPYGEWNTMFTYFCMNYAGVDSDDIPYGSGCWAWSLALDEAGLIAPVTRGSPQRGDILLMDYDADGKADRSCIVSRADDDELTVIEGDIGGSVAEYAYFPSDERFIGMLSLDGVATEPPVIPDEPAQLDFTAESESGIIVEAHADRGAFPYDTIMSVSDISRDEAIQTAAEQLGEDAENVDAVAVDITFTAPDGSELEPAEDSQVSVSITLPDEQALPDGEFTLLHVTDDGDVHEVADADVSADGAEFTAESFSIYVVTQFSGKDKDKIREYLDGYYLPQGTGEYTGFVPNTKDKPYLLRVGDVLKIYSDDVNSGFWTQYCTMTRTFQDYYVDVTVELIPDSETNLKDKWAAISRTSEHPTNWNDSTGRLWAEFIGKQSGYAVIHHTIPNQETEDFWIRVLDRAEDLEKLELSYPENASFNHADMEIADNGTYTITEVSNGVTTVKSYKAVVSKILNPTKICKIDGSVIQTIPIEAYKKLGTPGQPQYELTSAYYAGNYPYLGNAEPDPNDVVDHYEQGHPVFWSEPHWGVAFNPNEVDHVIFDVELTLIPDKQYTLSTDGNLENEQNLPGSNITISDVTYTMNKQDIIDAMNKCPLSNGFDFTVKASSALVTLEAQKTLIGRDIANETFNFELIDTTNAPHQTVAALKNDTNGYISFSHAFSEVGTYTYQLKEIANATDTSTLYDDTVFNITVNVENKNGMLVAKITYPNNVIPEFTNYQTYTLPSTGGTGTAPYIIIGTAMISGALLLLYRRRKKEVPH